MRKVAIVLLVAALVFPLAAGAWIVPTKPSWRYKLRLPQRQWNYIEAEVTAYTSRREETDDTPCLAEGSQVNVCEAFKRGYKLCACPVKYSFGTRVAIDGNIYICVDRMNERYQNGNYFDVYMGQGPEAIEQAKAWGRKKMTVGILPRR